MLCALIALVLLAAVAGCSDNSSERQQVVCEVQSVNAGAPLVAAYVQDGGDGVIDGVDDTFPTDLVSVAFTARPYAADVSSIVSDGVYSSFIITSYDLRWQPGANAPAGLDLSAYNVAGAPFYLQVLVGDDAAGAVLVGGRAVKEAVAGVLGLGWSGAQDFTAYAMLSFTGHASGSEHETTIESGVPVTFTYAVAQD